MSWHAANLALWIVALALEAALAVAVFARGIARAWPGFSALLVFYPLRASLLYLLSHRLDPAAFASSSAALSILALLLEAWVALELLLRLMRAGGAGAGRRIVVPAAIAAAAFTAASITLALIPARLVVDRAQVVSSWFFLALFAAACTRVAPIGNLTRIAAGLAAFSSFQLIALAGRAHAFLERSARSYLAWSYLPAAAWIAVVGAWLFLLLRRPLASPAPLTLPRSAP